MNLENAKSNICMAIGMIEGTEGAATAQAVGLLNGALAALETSPQTAPITTTDAAVLGVEFRTEHKYNGIK